MLKALLGLTGQLRHYGIEKVPAIALSTKIT